MGFLYLIFLERGRRKGETEKEMVGGDSCRVRGKSEAPEVIYHLSLWGLDLTGH